MKNTFVAEIEVPKSKRKSATAILKRIEALIAIAEPEHLEILQRSLEPKVVSSAEKELHIKRWRVRIMLRGSLGNWS